MKSILTNRPQVSVNRFTSTVVDNIKKQRYHDRSVRIPLPRIKYFKQNWQDIITPLVRHLGLHVKMDRKKNMLCMRIPAANNSDLEKETSSIFGTGVDLEIGEVEILHNNTESSIINFLSSSQNGSTEDSISNSNIPIEQSVVQEAIENSQIQPKNNTPSWLLREDQTNTGKFIDPRGDAARCAALQRGADFIHAISVGFEVPDAIAIIRLNDIFIDTVRLRDVKIFTENHMARAISRIIGRGASTKSAIENSTRTRLLVAGETVYILGAFEHTLHARRSVSLLAMGKPPNKIHGRLQTISRINKKNRLL